MCRSGDELAHVHPEAILERRTPIIIIGLHVATGLLKTQERCNQRKQLQ